MQLRSHLSTLVALGLLVLGGTLVVCRTTPGCFLIAQPRDESLSSKPTLGDKSMSITHERQHIQHATEPTFRNLVLESSQPVLVDFYADWCGPCQRLAPILEELAAENPNARIIKVNVDASPGLAEQYGVNSIPSLKVFKNGRVADELVGLASKGEIQALLAP
jgi:thioredoxin 1